MPRSAHESSGGHSHHRSLLALGVDVDTPISQWRDENRWARTSLHVALPHEWLTILTALGHGEASVGGR
jgi:hypothetical protein